ncbi:purine-nucleoside phosphorylase [Myroides injenensis]|uniref:purine-nucleoside phosphorylase n=1 Tax=Myroides injenensis TaxID=1183151 RepID=UPI0002892BD9|nr:purine-nucleoside phosphorylase [Myroides injenensis]
MWEQVQETVKYLNEKTNHFNPEIGIVLGSGLGNLTADIKIDYEIPYSEIPNFPVSTVQGHKGALIFGTIGGKKVVAMQGRFHYYEGYEIAKTVFPIRVMKYMGVKTLIVSNASGGVNPSFKVGDIMIITDHINAFPDHPLRGHNDERFGPRFVNMNDAYTGSLIKVAKEVAKDKNYDIKEGVYYGLQGPTFETLAEYKMVRAVGADCVGMSTVPEVIVARHMDMNVFGISVISDMGNEDGIVEAHHEEVLKAVEAAEPIARGLINELIARI